MGRFGKGNKYSTGRRPGSRNKALVLFDALGEEATPDAIDAIKKKIKEGDTHAAAVLLSHTWVRPRGRPVEFELPPVEKPADLIAAHAALVAAVARGELTPDEGAGVSILLENQRRAIETHDHEIRLQAMEEEARERARADKWSTLR